MTGKQEFLDQLRVGLAGLPQDDIDERIAFYSEMIDDRMDEGLSEQDAVAQIGNVDEIISQIVDDIPLTKIVKDKITPKRKLSGFEIALLIIGSPLWLSLLIVILSVVLTLYLCLWAIVISLWAANLTFALCALCGIVAGIFILCIGIGKGFLLIGAGIALAGLAIFLFFGCKAATKGLVALTKLICKWIKSLFIRKEKAR